MPKTKVVITGPLFDSSADASAGKFVGGLAGELAAIGATWIKVEAHGFDKSGRNTGAAAEGVEVIGQGLNYTVRGGIREGQYSWPWLEGTSQRNQTSKFKGYKTFSRTRARMRKQATPHAQTLLDEFLASLGGGEA